MARTETEKPSTGQMPVETTLHRLIVSSADAALKLRREDGSMPAGHNGPYHDPETPVRNTAHWLITFAKAHQVTGEARFVDAAYGAAGYLAGPDARPGGATFWHRTSPSKDRCNGLIGQAWTIEALAVAAETLDMSDLAALGETVFLLHPFDEREGLWNRVETDGTVLGFDATLNHQIWFAAAGALLLGEPGNEVDRQVKRFLDALPTNMSVHSNGLINHPVAKAHIGRGANPGIKVKAKSLALRAVRRGRSRQSATYKEIGYHAFNLYALSLLKQALPDHSFWQSDLLGRTLEYVDSAPYAPALDDNKYGYPYNPPGFEVAYALQVFADRYGRDTVAEISGWVSGQLERCYDHGARMMRLGTDDPETHAARIYEATRLADVPVRSPAMTSEDGRERYRN